MPQARQEEVKRPEKSALPIRRRQDRALEAHLPLDRKLYRVARRIRVLRSMEWPASARKEFLAGHQKGKPRLPKVEYPPVDFREEKAALSRILTKADRAHPIGEFLASTAEAYLISCQMLESIGTPAFVELSARLHGLPSEEIGWNEMSHLAAADHFIQSTASFLSSYGIPTPDYCLTARYVGQRIRQGLVPYLKPSEFIIRFDPNLPSRACAGGRGIKLRSRTPFSEVDIGQLLHHEGFVHLLTLLNGRDQKLKSLGLASPRTAKTQEGLATFAELVTGTMDLQRLLRLAMRIRAVHQALEGADFIETFRFFLASGQSPEESFHSARRIFRGGDTKGRIVFTKDVVYLQGLILTHTFLRKAMERNKFYLAHRLFCGRLSLGDTLSLQPYFENGFIRGPRRLPPWLHRRECLAAHLSYYVFADHITLSDVRLRDFFDI